MGGILIVLMVYVVVFFVLLLGEVVFKIFWLDYIDVMVIVIFVGGMVGGYIIFVGGYCLLDVGIKGKVVIFEVIRGVVFGIMIVLII